MKTYPEKPCLAPLTSIQISPQGHLTPCCWYQGRTNKSQFSIKNMSIQEYRETFLFPMHEKMKNNEYPDGCARCLNKGQTRVDYYNELYDKDRDIIIKDKPLRTMDLRLGNLCNISCITCTSYSSNYFYKVQEKGYYVWDDQVQLRKETDWVTDPEIMEDVKKNLRYIDRLYITGGEPTINPGIRVILQHLIDIGKTDVCIEMNTNLTNANKDFLDLVRHFKWKFHFSIDAIDELNDIIRWPSKWTSIEKNLKAYVDIATPKDCLVFVPTISIFNFFKLHEILEWMIDYTKQYPDLWFYTAKNLNILYSPEWMCIANIPDEYYQKQISQILDPYKIALVNKIYTYPYVKATETNSKFKDWDWNKILLETRKYFESRGYDPKITGIPGI